MDRIFLTALSAEAIIGIYDWEREVRQRIEVDLEMWVDLRAAAASDSIDDTLNYKAVAKRVLAFVQEAQALRELHQERRELLLAELSRPEISRESIQTLRAQELASIDALSQKLADAVVDAASILTPEQRARLVEYAEEMHGRHGH